MRTPSFKTVLAMTLCLKRSSPLHHSSLPGVLNPLSPSRRLCGVHFPVGLAALFFLFAIPPAGLVAQNIPPMIGEHIGKPKLRIPNPLGSAQTGSNQSSSGAECGQAGGSAAAE